ncbi:hypothetical protein QQ045_013644 [Rhodiola kirilowii]
MEGHINKAASSLSRCHSSLLRSSPTIRSSIQSLTEIDQLVSSDNDDDEHQKKERMSRTRSSNGPAAAAVMFLLSSVAFSSAVFFFFFYFYLNRDEISPSENLLLALVIIAVALFLVGRNKSRINRSVAVLRRSWERFFFFSSRRSRSSGKPIQFAIGDFESDGFGVNRSRQDIGVEFYSNGDCYEGDFHKGKCNGSGVYNYYVNGRYEGDWVDGKYDGFGIESWARGSRYKGQYRKGMRHGLGVYTFFTGDKYSGEWVNGQSCGVGSQECSDGSSYVGQFKCGVKHGIGCYHFRNGDKYAGEYFGDKIHGFGVYHFANGHCYEGSWYEGRKQGYGMYTFRNGDTRCGEWDSGSLKISLPPLTDSVLRDVQAARKTAKRAINLKRVQDQVDKAVLAANRAATAARVAAINAVRNQVEGKFCNIDNV